jgi:4-hydroxybenzoate polyprenyltransferase/phosphoserine phosphatase
MSILRKAEATSCSIVPLQAPAPRLLYVDMDGTLLATDVLWELFVLLLKTRPALLLRTPFWLIKGRAFLKRQLATHLTVNPALLPYHESVITFLAHEHLGGRNIILATASDRLVAERVARHLGIFSTVLGSDGAVNLRGREKLSAILRHANGAAFDYIGDSPTDLPIWRHASRAILVRPSRRLLMKVSRILTVEVVLCPRPPLLGALLRTLRVHQWSKNALLLVPLLLAHQAADLERLFKALLAFIAFSLIASASYILNDVLDLESDRQHPHKKLRPLATGLVPIPVAFVIAALAIASSVVIASALLPGLFAGILLLYFGTTTTYSFALKRIAILDVLVLAGLYTLRVLAGAVATHVPVSPWFLAFAMFFFLSLAFAKRYGELRLAGEQSESHDYLLARGYRVEDVDLLRSVGAASGYLAVAVLTLYINAPEVHILYKSPIALWLIGPLLLYWVTRLWFLANRGHLTNDPVVFALTDRPSYVLAGLVVTILIAASLLP